MSNRIVCTAGADVPLMTDPRPVEEMAGKGAEAELKIAFVSPGTYPPDFAGAQLRLHRTFLRLRKRQPLSVRVLALAGEATQAGWSEVDGIPVRRLSPDAGFLSTLWRSGAHLWDERKTGFDLVYCVTTGRLVYSIGAWARLMRRPLVVEFVNNNIEDSPARRWMAQHLARSAVLAIAISRPIFAQFRRLGVPEERIWLRPNPVDTARFRVPTEAERAAARQRLGVGPGTILHLLVGGLSKRKNHVVGIDAIERLPAHHRLLMAGPVIPDERQYAADLAARVAASPAASRLSLISEFVPDVEQLMYAADCLWMPSLEEGLGNVMLEALCCGVPCVISDRLGLEEHICGDDDGCAAPPSPGEWSAAVTSIEALIRNSPARQALGLRSQAAYAFPAIDAELLRRLNRIRASAPWTIRQARLEEPAVGGARTDVHKSAPE